MQMIGFWMSLIFLFWSLFYFYHYVLFNGTWWFVMVKMILNNVVNTAVCFVNWYIYIYLIFINTMTKVWINISVLLNFVFINSISMCMILQSCLLQTESDNIIRKSWPASLAYTLVVLTLDKLITFICFFTNIF